MINKYKKEIIKITATEILLSIADLATPFFDFSTIYKKSTAKYKEAREIN
jgi:hypothetical protein